MRKRQPNCDIGMMEYWGSGELKFTVSGSRFFNPQFETVKWGATVNYELEPFFLTHHSIIPPFHLPGSTLARVPIIRAARREISLMSLHSFVVFLAFEILNPFLHRSSTWGKFV